jgi:hypothetical protein
MPKPRIKELMTSFMSHFRSDEADEAPIPTALRHESPDVVFVSLLEDDAKMPATPSPVMPESHLGEGMPPLDLGAVMQPDMGPGMGPEAGMPLPPDEMMGF